MSGRPSQANPKLSEVIISSGTVLFSEGDRADAMYIVQQGEIDIAINKGVACHVRKGVAALVSRQ